MIGKAPILVSLFLLAATSLAQAEAPATQQQSNIAALRAETQQLEQAMYNLFNKLNSRDELDVACAHKAVTGSTIPVWQCDAAFMRDAASVDVGRRFDNSPARDMRFGYAPQSNKQLAFSFRKKTQQLNDEMKTLALKYPELGSAMLALHNKRQELAELTK